jgi:membrane-associated protease RseP (regulator of RpoE activity)
MTDVVESRTEGSEAPGEPVLPPPSKVLPLMIVAGLVGAAVWSVVSGNGIYMLGVLGFVVALLVSVTLHEFGHYLTARHYGMKSTQFFVGFGKTLWSRQRGETEWGIKAIPAGGFVKIVGMTSLEEIDPADEERAFYRQPAGQRAVVLAAGSTVHFLLAILLVVGSSMLLGKAVEKPPAVDVVASCVPAEATLDCDAPGGIPSPAQVAGLASGDTLLAVDGQPVSGLRDFVELVREAPGEPITVTVERAGERQDLAVTPAAVMRPTLDDPTVTEQVGAIGVVMQFRQGTESLGPVEAIGHSADTMQQMVTGIWTTLTEKLDTISQVYGEDRDPQGFVGVVGASRISGEVIASEETLAFKALGFLLLIAGLNLFVGVFNLLPLLPLDGGHLAVLGFEQARDKVKRRRGYTGPLRRVDLNRLLPVTYAVVLFFAGFTIWLLGADLVNPIRLNS